MALIGKIFEDEMKEIGWAIDDLKKEGCIRKYCDYLYSKPESEIEKKFVNMLNDRKERLCVNLVMKRYKAMTKEDLLKVVEECVTDGYYSVTEEACEQGLGEVLLNRFADADIFTDIKNELAETYLIMEKELNMTTPEKEAEDMLRQINGLLKQKESSESYAKNLSKEISELQRQHDEFVAKIPKL